MVEKEKEKPKKFPRKKAERPPPETITLQPVIAPSEPTDPNAPFTTPQLSHLGQVIDEKLEEFGDTLEQQLDQLKDSIPIEKPCEKCK